MVPAGRLGLTRSDARDRGVECRCAAVFGLGDTSDVLVLAGKVAFACGASRPRALCGVGTGDGVGSDVSGRHCV